SLVAPYRCSCDGYLRCIAVEVVSAQDNFNVDAEAAQQARRRGRLFLELRHLDVRVLDAVLFEFHSTGRLDKLLDRIWFVQARFGRWPNTEESILTGCEAVKSE